MGWGGAGRGGGEIARLEIGGRRFVGGGSVVVRGRAVAASHVVACYPTPPSSALAATRRVWRCCAGGLGAACSAWLSVARSAVLESTRVLWDASPAQAPLRPRSARASARRHAPRLLGRCCSCVLSVQTDNVSLARLHMSQTGPFPLSTGSWTSTEACGLGLRSVLMQGIESTLWAGPKHEGGPCAWPTSTAETGKSPAATKPAARLHWRRPTPTPMAKPATQQPRKPRIPALLSTTPIIAECTIIF